MMSNGPHSQSKTSSTEMTMLGILRVQLCHLSINIFKNVPIVPAFGFELWGYCSNCLLPWQQRKNNCLIAVLTHCISFCLSNLLPFVMWKALFTPLQSKAKTEQRSKVGVGDAQQHHKQYKRTLNKLYLISNKVSKNSN